MIKCPKCGTKNPDKSPFCRRCKTRFDSPKVPLKQEIIWQPDWKWHLKTLAIIYAVVVALYLGMNSILKPYIRNMPEDVTPWLKK